MTCRLLFLTFLFSGSLRAQILMYENRPAVGNNSISSTPNPNPYVTNGLVEWNPFDDAPGTTIARDASGNSNTVPLIGAPIFNGDHLTLNGTNQYGNAGTNQLESLDLNDISVCVWLNKNSYSERGIVDKSFDNGSGTYGGWSFRVLPNGHLDWWLQENAQTVDVGAQSIVPGQWIFVSAVYHYATHKVDFYFDGLLNSSVGNGGATARSGSAANLEIGNLNNNASGGLYAFDGSMKQLAIYNRALSADEIKYNFQNSEATTNVSVPDLLYWKMTEYPNVHIPVYLADSSTHGGTFGTVHSAYDFQWVTNQALIPNSAGHFNGVTSYVETSNSVLFNFTTNLFTINMWLCPLTANGYVLQNGIDNQTGYRLSVGGNYELIFGSEANAGESSIVTGPGAANVNIYTMVTIVRTDPTTILIYLNGNQTGTTGSFANPAPSANTLIFGIDRNGYDHLDGDIWVPQIWSRPLTGVEVANLFFTQSYGYPWP